MSLGSWNSLLGLGRGCGSGGLGGGWLSGGLFSDDWLGLNLLLDDGLTAHLDNLAGDSLFLADGVLGATGITLSILLGDANLLRLELVDGLDQDVLVLELVTLGAEVELVVDVLVDLLGVTVLLQETSQDTGSAHSDDLGGHTGIAGTLTVTGALVTALALFGLVTLYAGARVHGDLATDDEAVFVELADVLAGVGKSNLGGLIGVNPDSLLTALKNGGGESSLQSEHTHFLLNLFINNRLRHANILYLSQN